MKPKYDGGYCKLQKNIILHGGDNHIQNLYFLIYNTFNTVNSYELSIHAFTDNKTVRKPLYTLNFVENGGHIKQKHRGQISKVLNKSFSSRAEGQQEQFTDPNVSYILILKNDNVVACLYFCEFPYADNMISHLRKRHPGIKDGDIYIYNLAIDPNERGQKFCNYLISNGLCFLRKRFSKNMWLIAENPKHSGVSGSAGAANACYSKFMKHEPDCEEHQFCYYAVQKELSAPTLPNFRETRTTSPTDPNSLSSHLEHIKESIKQTCENRNYKVINTATCSITGESLMPSLVIVAVAVVAKPLLQLLLLQVEVKVVVLMLLLWVMVDSPMMMMMVDSPMMILILLLQVEVKVVVLMPFPITIMRFTLIDILMMMDSPMMMMMMNYKSGVNVFINNKTSL